MMPISETNIHLLVLWAKTNNIKFQKLVIVISITEKPEIRNSDLFL